MSPSFLGILGATTLTGFALGFAKFYWLESLLRDVYGGDLAAKPMLIQIVGAFITLGPVLVYIISGPLAAAFRKSQVMLFSAGFCAAMYGISLITGGGKIGFLYVFLTGLVMGIFSAGKMSCVVLEARQSGMSPYAINGGMSIVFIFGMMVGIPSGSHVGTSNPELGLQISLAVFALSALASAMIKFRDEPLIPFQTAYSELGRDTWRLMARYLDYLIASPMTWGMAAALSLAVTAYLEVHFIAGATKASMISLYSTLGIIAGNAWAPRLKDVRHSASVRYFLILTITIALFPIIFKALPLARPETMTPEAIEAVVALNSHWYFLAVAMMLVIGFSFGVMTNIVDADFLKLASDMGLEGTGAALQSAFVAFFSFAIGAGSGLALEKQWINSETQFVFILGTCVIILICLFAILFRYGDARPVANTFIRPLLSFCARLRYKIEIRGLAGLPKDKGYLFLPNHPAEVDPLLVTLTTFKNWAPRPFVTEKFVEMGGLKSLMKMVKAVAVPDTDDGAGSFKLKRIEKCLDHCVENLKGGDSFLFYPAGRLQRSGLEDLRGASGLFGLLKRDPKVPVVLVRTRGLWGSRFSTALTSGITPDLGTVLKECITDLFKNLIFFTPRRRITMEFVAYSSGLPEFKDKLELNAWLNSFYNEPGEEELVRTPRFFFSSAGASIQETGQKESMDVEIPKDVEEAVKAELAQRTARPAGEILASMSLADDLGLDSLDRAELLPWLDEKFHQNDVEVTELTSVYSVMKLAHAGTGKETSGEEVKTPANWDTHSHPALKKDLEANLISCFLNRVHENPQAIACGDEVTGILSRKRMLIGALALAQIIREEPGQHFGVLMPASNGAAVMVLATLLAGKIPVMLNWTVGARNMNHVREIAGLKRVLTSRRFLDRAGDIELGEVEDILIFVEDMRENSITLPIKLKAAWDASKSPEKLMRQLHLDTVKPEDPAVILFTSGSEAAPKGVPLSHHNLLNNIRRAMQAFELKGEDVLYGFLPPFHSFGFTITTLLPLMSGMRVAFYPNPTDARRLARGIGMWKISLACGTPSFLRRILAAATPAQTQSLRYLLAGAEKADDELFSLTETIGARLLEGYGITECSPVISLNRVEEPRIGVGRPIDGTEILIVDPETSKPLAQGERGMILVRGESVFQGYLGNVQDPFVEAEGKSWYKTGDLGFLSESGALTLSGRLKRFVKVAGEMISLPAMEEILIQQWPHDDEGPRIAVEALEIDGQRPVLCLFTRSLNIEVEEANALLRQAGFAVVGRLSEVRNLEALPLLGTGKTDYRSLKTLLTDSRS